MIEIQNVKCTKIITHVLFLFTLVCLFGAKAEAVSPANVKIMVEGKHLEMLTPPVIVSDRTLVSVRSIGEAVGGVVTWDPVGRKATITRGSDQVVISLGDQTALVNGEPVLMEVPAQIVDDRTMVPLRFIAEALGATVEWDPVTRTANILEKATRVLGMTYRRDVGKAVLALRLSAAPTSLVPHVSGNKLTLDLFPALLDTEERNLGAMDMLAKGFTLRGEGRTVKVEADLWHPPVFRYSVSPDGTELLVELDYTVTGIQFQQDGRIPVVNVAANGKLNYNTMQLDNPARVVLDIKGARPGTAVPPVMDVGNSVLSKVRTGMFTADTMRLVLDTLVSVPYEVVSTDLGLQVRFVPQIQAVRVDKLQGKTRLTINSSLPLDARVTALAAEKQLRIEVPQGRSALADSLIRVSDGTIDSITVSPGSSRDSTLITVKLPYYLGHTQVSQNGATSIVVDLVTSPIAGKRIWIDAGHGGDDPGAIGKTFGTREKDLTLPLALELQRQLQEAGAIVYMTRTTDKAVSLQDRANLANAVSPAIDLFISIHFNSAGTASARGLETYYWTTNPKSRNVAEHIHAALLTGMGLPDRKIRQQDFYVIKNTKAPSVLLELGYLSNPDEERTIAEPGVQAKTFLRKAAESTKKGILDYFWQEIRGAVAN